MFKAKFKSEKNINDFKVSPDEWGEVVAQETRDGVAFVVVRFADVEVNGLTSDAFRFEEFEEPKENE